VTMIFPGHSEVQGVDRTYRSVAYSSIEIRIDGECVGSGDGANGFKIDFMTTVGMRNPVFMWSKDSTGWSEGNSITYLKDTHYRTDVEVVFTKPGHCVMRLGYRSENMRVRRFEPRRAGYVAFSGQTIVGILVVGLALVAISSLVLYFRV